MANDIARRVHDGATVVDAVCPPMYWTKHWRDWLEGGASACGVSVVGMGGAHDALYSIAETLRFVRETPELRLATSVADIRKAKADNALAVILHIQGAEPIEYEPALVEAFWRMGVRIIQLAYNRRNPLCDGCEEPNDAGLSVIGRRVVAELNRVGILVDVSHTGTRSSFDAVEASGAPVIASHSNSKAVYDSPRNLPDDLVKAIAASGGVIGMNGYPWFVAASGRPTLDEFIDHFSYVADLVGIEHVALGIDYYEGSREEWEAFVASGAWNPENYPPPPYIYPAGLERPSGLPALTERLLQRGFGEEDVRGILGENWLRLYDRVWL